MQTFFAIFMQFMNIYFANLLISEDIIISVYQSLGCWADASDWWNPQHRTIPSLEGTDNRLMDEYRMRKDPIGKAFCKTYYLKHAIWR